MTHATRSPPRCPEGETGNAAVLAGCRDWTLEWDDESPYWPSGLAIKPEQFYDCLELWLNNGGLATVSVGHGIPKQTDDDGWTRFYDYDGAKFDDKTRIDGRTDPVASGDTGIVRLAYAAYWTENLMGPDDFLELVDMARATQEKYKHIGGFYPSGLPYFLYAQFAQIYSTLYTCFGAGMAACAALLVGTFFSLTKKPGESIILTFVILISICTISFFTAGVFSYQEVYFNVFSLLALITSIGIAVEFTVHIVFAYANASGTREERTIAAVEHMLLPIIDSSLSTQLGIVPLTFTGQRFIFKYSFVAYSFLVLAGLIAGLVTVPLLLTTIGPSSPPRGH